MKKNINRFMAAFLIALLFVGGMPGNLQKKSGFLLEAKAGCGTRESAVQWVLSQEGKHIDYDGAYGCQCVDLIKAYYAHFGVAQYARGNGNQYASNTLPPGWTRIRNYAEFVPEPGDIAVWGTGIGRNGHVAIILSANVNRFTSMDQNWPTGSGCKKVNHNYRHFWGVIRPDFEDSSKPKENEIAPELHDDKNEVCVRETITFTYKGLRPCEKVLISFANQNGQVYHSEDATASTKLTTYFERPGTYYVFAQGWLNGSCYKSEKIRVEVLDPWIGTDKNSVKVNEKITLEYAGLTQCCKVLFSFVKNGQVYHTEDSTASRKFTTFFQNPGTYQVFASGLIGGKWFESERITIVVKP